MANTYLGVGVVFGVGDTAVSASTPSSAVGTFKLQSKRHRKTASVEEIADEDGETIQVSFFNKNEEATFEYIVTGASTADAVTANKIPDAGTLLTVTDTKYTALAQSNWVVMDSENNASNTTATKVTLNLKRWPNVTAVTT